jgi:hypothetical protein
LLDLDSVRSALEGVTAAFFVYRIRAGLALTWHGPMVNGINDVQERSKTHFQVTLARVRVWHTLRNHYFALYFPEIDRLVSSDHSVWLIQLLTSFPTPASITALSEEEFQTRAWNLVGRKVSKRALLAEIYAAPNSRSACQWRSIVPR